jgi:ABC-type oligopeptide transport system ATPase subunit
MTQGKKHFLIFLTFIVLIGLFGVWLGTEIQKTKEKKVEIELNLKIKRLLVHRDSLEKLYFEGNIQLQKTLDSLRLVNNDRKKWRALYYSKMREPLPANSKELEKQIYELLKLIRGEVLPD